jgi:peptide/nickel transport system substrate-binding protein
VTASRCSPCDSTYLKSKASADDPYAVKWSAANGNYGFGAYDLSSFTAGQQLVLKANANYYGGAPKIQTVIQKVVADPGQRASLLANGSVDIAVQLRPSDIKSLQGNSSVSTFKGLDTVNYTNLDLNVTTGTFSKLAIRQALKYAIPYDQINTNVYNGQLTAMKGFINPRYPGADLDGLSAGTYDPAKSKSILAAAGITTPVSFTLLVNTAIPDLGQVAVQMQSAGSAAGFDIKLQNEPSAAFSDATGNHKYEAALVHDGSISQAPPYELMLAYTKDSPLNTTGWTDQAYYDLVNKGIDAGDALSAAAGKFWNQAQLEWQTQTPSIPMGFIQPLLAVRSDVKGYYYRTEQAIDFAHISKG